MTKTIMIIVFFTAWGCKSQDCVDQGKVEPEKVCYQLYEPVCGCDGKTYSNACEAEKAGLTSWKQGECD